MTRAWLGGSQIRLTDGVLERRVAAQEEIMEQVASRMNYIKVRTVAKPTEIHYIDSSTFFDDDVYIVADVLGRSVAGWISRADAAGLLFGEPELAR